MGRLAEMFARHRAAGTGALMPFIVAGDPGIKDLPVLLQALEKAGADAVEIGIPFSDPIADGPLIAAAMHAALESGTRVDSVLAQVRACRDSIRLPLLAMVSISSGEMSASTFDCMSASEFSISVLERRLVSAFNADTIGRSQINPGCDARREHTLSER